MLTQEMESPKYARFNVSVVTFKKAYGHAIEAYILVPKNVTSGKHPLFVKIHGGGFVCGSGIHAEWFAPYLLDLAVEKGAVIVAPNYRLIPESSMLDMLSDINDFWTWTRSSDFQSNFSPFNIEADIGRTLLYGDSAGGYLAVQSALSQPAGTIKAVIAAYPLLDVECDYYSKEFEKHPFGVPTLPKSLLEDHLAAIHPDPTKRQLFSDTLPGTRLSLMLTIMQQGRTVEFFGQDDAVYPFRMLQKREEKLPFMFFYQGDNDSAVYYQDSIKFSEGMKKKFGPESYRLHIEKGAEHGFDGGAQLGSTPWLDDGLETVLPLWLE